MKYYFIRTNHAIPIGYYFEGPVTEPDDISMVKVCVGCKEHSASIKLCYLVESFTFDESFT